jgi:hypothetical protein
MGVNTSYLMFGNPALSKSQRVTTNIFGGNYEVYFKGYFDSSQAATNAAAVQALVPVNPAQRVLTLIGNNNLIPLTLTDGTVANTSIGGMVNWDSRNFLQGPGQWNQDASLRKTFTIKEHYRLLLSGDFFNAFNHPNNVSPSTTTGLINLGLQANSARIIQLSGKFEF